MKQSKELHIAIEASTIAVHEAMKYFLKHIAVETKNDGSLITIADTKVEDKIKSFILKHDKTAKFVAEETNEEDSKGDTYWVIDPIDGTRAFAHGTPFWCVLIAYVKNGRPTVGVVNFPLLGGILSAETGKGAYLNGKKIHASNVKKVKDAFISFGSMKRFKDKTKIIQLIEAAGSTRSPEPTYSCFLVAQGKVDMCIDEYAYIWDRAPFQVIIPEAGGRISNLLGKPLSRFDRGYIVTNGNLLDEVVTLYNSKSSSSPNP